MSRTYDFVVEQARAARLPPAKLLDVGCGAGQIVGKALDAGYDARGADLFAGISDQYRNAATALSERLHLMPGPGILPFPGQSFDIAVSNQFFEHVEDKPAVLAELARVLKPGAPLIAIFPTREVIIEPHLKAPLIHRFGQNSGAQTRALNLCASIGWRSHEPAEHDEWVDHAQTSLDEDMFYERERDIPKIFAPWFTLTRRAEPEFLRDRLAQSRLLAPFAKIPDAVLRVLTIRMANAVFIFTRN
jgi:SAM-dependent methyltransferase